VEDHPWAHAGEWGDHRPDMKSRWNADRDLGWEALRLEKVVEVKTTQHSSRRLRHPAHVVRWRDDKRPEDCTLDQLKVIAAAELSAVLS
jgi:hypothetical protein